MNTITIVAIALFSWVIESPRNDIKEFHNQYSKDFDSISKNLQNVTGTLKLNIKTKDASGKTIKSAQDFAKFSITGNLGKCVRDVERTVGKQTKVFQAVYVQTADSYFTLTKNKGESEYSLDNFGPLPKPGEIPKAPIEFRLFCGSFWNAPYLFMSSDWRGAISNDSKRSVSIENIEREGKKIVKLVIHYTANPDRTTEFELDPAVNHRILRSAIVMNGRSDFQYQVEYLADSVIPKVVTYTGPSEEMRCEFSDLKFEPTPDEDFQPKYFGLPNFKTAVKSNWFSLVNWILPICAFIAALFVIKKQLAKRINHAV